SFKAICDATAKFYGDGDNKREQSDIEALWQSWTYLTDIDDIRQGTNQNEYKKDYIQFHAVMINAYGYAVSRLLQDHSVTQVTEMIDKLAMKTESWQKEYFFLIKNWNDICVDSSKGRPLIMANVAGQKAAAERLYDAITRQSMELN
ncbi:MAG: hypothetical protein ACRDA8_00965, partial [Shewanella sp.]